MKKFHIARYVIFATPVFTVCAPFVLRGAHLRPADMEILPLGSVQPCGWLSCRLQHQRDGLTGHAEELYDDIGRSDWPIADTQMRITLFPRFHAPGKGGGS